MKKVVFVIILSLVGLNLFGQVGRNMNNRVPQASREPSEKDIEKRNRLMEERKNEYIDNFLSTLEGDEFQREIIKQYLNSYYDAKIKLLKTPFEHHFEREQAIKNLDESHFINLKDLISDGDMSKIKEMIKGKFDEKEVVKDKKKKKRKKKKKSKNDEG